MRPGGKRDRPAENEKCPSAELTKTIRTGQNGWEKAREERKREVAGARAGDRLLGDSDAQLEVK